MPGKSYAGPLPPLTPHESALSVALRRDVEKIAGEIGEHNYLNKRALDAVADFIDASFSAAGHAVRSQEYRIDRDTFRNIEVEIRGTDRSDEIVIVGAHYDSVIGSPGANDNGSGVAAVLAMSRALAGSTPSRTLRFVAFVNEEPPFFQTGCMGSLVYAARCKKRGEKVVAMMSLETIGYYSDEEGSQHYPPPFSFFYPSKGDFIGFVGNVSSRRLVRKVVASFRKHAMFPSEGGAIPGFVIGIGWSDHWAFWKMGYPALMVTDTAPFRYPYYHTREDTPDKIDYERTARVVAGLEKVVADLVDAGVSDV